MASSPLTLYDSRIEMLALKLESLTNNSAKEYLTRLDNYTRHLSIIRTWPLPPTDFLPLDDSEGVVWVALIPILYFLVVIGLLGALVAYVWYVHHCDERTNRTAGGCATSISINSGSQLNNSNNSSNNNNNKNKNNTDSNNIIIIHNSNKNGGDNDDDDNDNNNNSDTNSIFSRGVVNKTDKNCTAIESMIRASMTSRGSNRSAVNFSFRNNINKTPNGINNNNMPNMGSPFSSTRNPLYEEMTRTFQGQGEIKNLINENENGLHSSPHRTPSRSRYPINLSQSFYSSNGDGDDDDFTDSSYNNGDRFSRDSLRTSMESQKLLATGEIEIAPDDLYSMSDNTAYAGNDDDDGNKINNTSRFQRHQNRRSAKSCHYEICQTTATSGVENPSFQIESDESERLFLEDPMGYLVDHTNNHTSNPQDQNRHNQNGGDGAYNSHVMNTSSVSATATHFQTSSLFGGRNSLSESFTSATSSNSSLQEQSAGIIINKINASNAIGGNTNTTNNTLFGRNSSSNRNAHNLKSNITTLGGGNKPQPLHNNSNHEDRTTTTTNTTTAKLVKNNYMSHAGMGVGVGVGGVGVGVGRALPPLPPSHYPRHHQQQQLEAPGGPQLINTNPNTALPPPSRHRHQQHGNNNNNNSSNNPSLPRHRHQQQLDKSNSNSNASSLGVCYNLTNRRVVVDSSPPLPAHPLQPLHFVDTSSMLDTSNESAANLSLPSSIARFHASRVQPRPSPRDRFPSGSTTTDPPPIADADWSPPCRRRLDVSPAAAGQGHHATDTFSMCPNRGSFSFSQSFDVEESKSPKQDSGSLAVEAIGHSRFILESSDDEEDKERQNDEANPRSEAGSYDRLNADAAGGGYSGDKKGRSSRGVKCVKNLDGEEMDFIDDVSRENGEEKRGAMMTKTPREVIKSDRNPRMKRMMSLDWLKSGKVSVEKRLREFGYVKPRGKKTYVETEDLA